MCTREARQRGRPGDKYTVVYLEVGLCRRPYCRHLGSPTLREGHRMDLHTYESRSVPEASLCVQGAIDKVGDPVIDTLKYTWNPVYAGFFTSGKPGKTRGSVIKLSNIHGKQHCCNSNRTNLCVPLCKTTVIAIGKRCPPRHALQSIENTAQPRVSTTLV